MSEIYSYLLTYVSSDTHLLRIHDLDYRIYVGTFQYFVYSIRRGEDCSKSAGTYPCKIYVRTSNTPRVSNQWLYDSVK